MRPIDADELSRKIQDVYHGSYSDVQIAPYQIDRMIDAQPTVDTAQAVHAHWIAPEIKNGVYKGRRIVLCDRNGYVSDGPCECSNCGSVLIGSDEYAMKGRYCPNCGAKMEGNKNEA